MVTLPGLCRFINVEMHGRASLYGDVSSAGTRMF